MRKMTIQRNATRVGARILTLCILVCSLLGLLSGCLGGIMGKAEPKTFSKAGMEITLTEDFREGNIEGFTAYFESKEAGILAIREDFSLAAGLGDLTLEEYCAIVVQNNAAAGMQTKTDGEHNWMEHRWTNPDNGITYCYTSFAYKASDAFWLFQFYTTKDKAESYFPYFLQWADSIRFTNN